ncbi:MAG: hypothetical protein O7E57_03450 [Gammaproteobacteria bacterium]|nr:hypothetical protein [Gammaproteobacteria bacterium]
MSELLSYSSILLVISPIFVLALRHSQGLAGVLALTSLGLLFIPVDGVSLILALKGVFADLSLTTVLLLITWPLLRIANISPNGSDIAWLCTAILILALALYPMALGVGLHDSYVFGYEPWLLLTLVAAMGVLAVDKRYWISAATGIVVLYGYWLRVLPSQNLWDYLLDPMLVIFALIYLLQYLTRLRIWCRSRGTPRST